MAVYLRKGSPFYQVEFEFKNQRIRRSSGTTNERRAEAYERRLRKDLHDQFYLGIPVVQRMSIRAAVDRYISTHLRLKTRRKKTADNDVYLLDGLIEWVGGDDVYIDSLTTQKITDLRDDWVMRGRHETPAEPR